MYASQQGMSGKLKHLSSGPSCGGASIADAAVAGVGLLGAPVPGALPVPLPPAVGDGRGAAVCMSAHPAGEDCHVPEHLRRLLHADAQGEASACIGFHQSALLQSAVNSPAAMPDGWLPRRGMAFRNRFWHLCLEEECCITSRLPLLSSASAEGTPEETRLGPAGGLAVPSSARPAELAVPGLLATCTSQSKPFPALKPRKLQQVGLRGGKTRPYTPQADRWAETRKSPVLGHQPGLDCRTSPKRDTMQGAPPAVQQWP